MRAMTKIASRYLKVPVIASSQESVAYVDDDRDVRRAEGAVDGDNRARQVAGFAEREEVARRDQHLHGEPARRR